MPEISYLSVKTHYSNPDSLKMKINRSPSKPSDYLDGNDSSANIVFSENGNFYNWTEKHQELHSSGRKYVHSVTLNVVENLNKSSSSRYYKFNLIAKNKRGAIELNRLASQSFLGRGSDSENPNFYYEPRISLEAFLNQSVDTIVILDPYENPLYENYKANMKEDIDKWIIELSKVKDRVWLSIASFPDKEQVIINNFLKGIAQEHGFKMLYMDNVYSHNKEYEEYRHLINLSQNPNYESNGKERYLKSYEEVVSDILSTNVFTEEEVKQLIEEANVVYSMVEDFELDDSPKYPHVSDNPLQDIQRRIAEGYKLRDIDKLPTESQKVYKERVVYELEVMRRSDNIDYMLLEYYIKRDMREKFDILPGPGRGSVGGSLIAYLLMISDVDPIKHDLMFERFINEDRVDLADIDSDWPPEERNIVQQYLLEHEKYNCASIITFGTLGVKSGFKDIGRAMGYDFQQLNFDSKTFKDTKNGTEVPNTMLEKYKDIFDVIEKIDGLIVSVGRHAAGIIVSDRELSSDLGVCLVKDFAYDTSFIDMNQVSRLQYVKLDVLGLKNLEHINKATEFSGFPKIRTTSDYIDYNDWKIVEDLAEHGTATVFQIESDTAQASAKKLFSKKTIERIRKDHPNITVIDLFSILLAVIRPSAASILENVVNGRIKDNGVDVLNEILSDSYGWMIYQEQSIAYLKFVGFSGSQSDTIRRAIGKKKRDVMENTLPEIKAKSIEKISERVNLEPDLIEQSVDEFIKIFIDSADYSFNKSHSIEYSYIAYQTAWLRLYHPIEWVTAGLITWSGNQDKVNMLTNLAKQRGINIEPAKFRYSKGHYFFNKETNTIYEGTAPIKGNNAQVGDALYGLREEKFNSFTDFMIKIRDDIEVSFGGKRFKILDILNRSEEDVKDFDKQIKTYNKENEQEVVVEKDKLSIDKGKLLPLIRLGYFSEFGGNEKLEAIFTKFDKDYKPNNKTFASKAKKYKEILEYEKDLPDTSLPIFDQAEYELELLGRVVVQNDQISPKYAFVTDIRVGKTIVSATLYSINKSTSVKIKVGVKLYRNLMFDIGDLIEVTKTSAKPKNVNIDGVWQKHPTDKELWLEDGKRIRKSKKAGG